MKLQKNMVLTRRPLLLLYGATDAAFFKAARSTDDRRRHEIKVPKCSVIRAWHYKEFIGTDMILLKKSFYSPRRVCKGLSTNYSITITCSGQPKN